MKIPGLTLGVTICLLAAGGFPTAAQTPNPVAALSPIPAFQQPELFIDKCPTTDPAYAIIRADFAILRDGNPVPPIQCVEPFSAIPPPQYSEELVIIQALRIAYYKDQGHANYLPRNPLRFHDWVKSKISWQFNRRVVLHDQRNEKGHLLANSEASQRSPTPTLAKVTSPFAGSSASWR